jgi:hypothetical protein
MLMGENNGEQREDEGEDDEEYDEEKEIRRAAHGEEDARELSKRRRHQSK